MKNKFFVVFSLVITAITFSTNSFAFDVKQTIKNMVVGPQNRPETQEEKLTSSFIQGAVDTYRDNKQRKELSKLRGIEQTEEWQEIFRMMLEGTQKMDDSMANLRQQLDMCSKDVVGQFYENSRNFEGEFSARLPKKLNYPSQSFDVASFNELSRSNQSSYGQLQAIHIPNVQGVNVMMHRQQMNVGNIYQNFSAMTLPAPLVQAVQQQYQALGRNPQNDAANLYLATLKDMTNIGYFIIKNPQLGIRFEDYLISALGLYSRNKVMCLYEVTMNDY